MLIIIKDFSRQPMSLKKQKDFLSSGFYHGELSDSMVMATSNALQLVITVFSSVPNHALINILPRSVSAPIPLFIAYNQYGAGHYDGIKAEMKESIVIAQPSKSDTHCTCGKNDKKGETHCHPKTRKYTTVCSCTCYNRSKKCTTLCKCRS